MQQSYPPEATDFRSLVSRMKGMKPDLVFMVLYVNDGATIVKQAKQLGLKPKLFVGNGGGFTMPAFAKLADGAQRTSSSCALDSPCFIPGSGGILRKLL